MINGTPCKNCADRHMGCHCGCGKYKAYKKEAAEIRKNRRCAVDLRCSAYESASRVKRIRSSNRVFESSKR